MGLFRKKNVEPNIDLSSITAESIFLIEDSFFIDGLVKVVGRVVQGKFFPKKSYTLIHNGNEEEVYIANIEEFFRAVDLASAGMSVGFTLSNLVDKREIAKGDIILSK